MLGGLYWRADFTLVPGRVLYDYLEPPAKGPKRSRWGWNRIPEEE
jgi:hypothetical protein